MSLSKKDLLGKKEALLKQLGGLQKQLYNVEGAVMFIDLEIKKMKEQEVIDVGKSPRID
ncbi:hypothetical protein LCGC14_2723770 [marine sediment metagenome]|uniref:Uncharacterized protein n=1 Tax=marine sediment metagenome TaxID=412755 RepID=A0A0F9BII3_9ZZZZ